MSQSEMGRLHIGVVPGSGKSRQASIVFTEHQEVAPDLIGGRIQIRSVVVHVERQFPVLEQVRDRVVEIAKAAQARGDRPCFFIDAGSGMGAGLVKILADMRANGKFPPGLHRPHAYTQRGQARQALVNAIVASYGGGKLKFAPGLPLQTELIRALETYETTVADDGRVSYEGDEEMVLALGLSLAYASHGSPMRYVRRGGTIVATRSLSPDPY
jgi:hypothetical protein